MQRVKTSIKERGYGLDLNELREAMGEIYQTKNNRHRGRGLIAKNRLKEVREEMVENEELERDGDVWMLPGQEPHPAS